MGSEGRGEQILKTDQDNALLLRDGVDLDGVEAVATRFNAALAELGYPPCPGQIMLTNPLWCQPISGFRATLREWVYGADPDGPMRLAIFFDAACVAGDERLLHNARDHLESILVDNDAFLARFASAADQFSESSSWWSWLSPNRSAFSITITVAFGTSSPTSTTTVATSTSIFASRKSRITASFSSGGISRMRSAQGFSA
jgi:CBS domain-containing protein